MRRRDKRKVARDEKIRQWRTGANPLTQDEVAKKLHITRQRVQQIERRLGIPPTRVLGVLIRYPFTCKFCGKEGSAGVSGRKYCSRSCFGKARQEAYLGNREAALQLKRERNRVRAYEYYHNVFKKNKNWRKIVQMRNKKYAGRRRKKTV